MRSSLKLPEKTSVTASGAHNLLGFDYVWSFETPRIKNHSFTTPSALVVLGEYSAQSFETPKKNQSVTAPSAHIVLDPIH